MPRPRPTSRTNVSTFLEELDRDHLPHLSVNGVIFGAHDGVLKVLTMRWRDLPQWGLPGGYVRRTEDVDRAAARMVRDHVGLAGVYLRQFHTFGGAKRIPSGWPASLRRNLGRQDHWAFGRVVSVGYVALVDFTRARVTPDESTSEYAWRTLAELPRLVLDHREMVDRALVALRDGIDSLPLGASLLPGAFTMPELQRLYETVLGRPLDRRNFQNRMLGLGLVERLPEPRPSRVSRPTYLYRWIGRAESGD